MKLFFLCVMLAITRESSNEKVTSLTFLCQSLFVMMRDIINKSEGKEQGGSNMIDTVRGPIHKSQLGVTLGHEHMKWEDDEFHANTMYFDKRYKEEEILSDRNDTKYCFPRITIFTWKGKNPYQLTPVRPFLMNLFLIVRNMGLTIPPIFTM